MILQNHIRCLKCGDEPYSAHVHDFKSCECGAVSVDGGMDYLRRVGDLDKVEEMSIEMDDGLAKIMWDEIEEATVYDDKNSKGVLCAIARAIRDAGYEIKKI